ncbi:MAG: GNAT family N-acetyltransferase [Clostridiales bacterium]|nr:GNAT family N-acetyltransferase [Clostridiales bacterium]
MKNVLQCVVFNLSREWEQEEHALRERLAREGILCVDFAKTDGSLTLIKKNEAAVVLTDSPEIGAELVREGIIYFGCCHAQNVQGNQASAMESTGTDADTDADTNMGSGWFDGAALVLEGFEEVDAEYLEQWMLRAKGMPAMIARTNRLTIREIADEDISELERIGRECGEAEAQEETNEELNEETKETNEKINEGILYAGKNTCEEKELHAQGNRFTKEYLYSYRRTAYRLQGFGLWSVLYRDRVIGCCGFEPWDTELEPAESAAPRIVSERKKTDAIQSLADILPDQIDQPLVCTDTIISYHLHFKETSVAPLGIILEMQYMLDPVYHRQGFGTEMCQALLAYARERLDADEVRLRIREDNLASRALAEKLGFVPEE